MGTFKEQNGSQDMKAQEIKSWLYIVALLVFFLLFGSCVKWISAVFHGPH